MRRCRLVQRNTHWNRNYQVGKILRRCSGCKAKRDKCSLHFVCKSIAVNVSTPTRLPFKLEFVAFLSKLIDDSAKRSLKSEIAFHDWILISPKGRGVSNGGN